MPRGQYTKRPTDTYGISSICITFPETPNIHELSAHPKTSIRWQGLGMVTNTLESKEGVGFLDLRSVKRRDNKKCVSCTKTFGYSVLEDEHDQRNHWKCPKTLIYTHERDLDRYCRLCEGTVGDKHEKGTKFHCPTEGKSLRKIHLTFNALTIKGEHQQLNIRHDRPLPPVGEELKDFTEEFEELLKPHDGSTLGGNSRAKIEKNMFVIWKQDIDMNQKSLPWVLGKCHGIDKKNRTYTMRIYAPKPELDIPLWNCDFRHTDKEVDIIFGTEMYYPVKRPRKKISTNDILQLAQSGKYGWTLESLYNTPSSSEKDDVMNEKFEKEEKEEKNHMAFTKFSIQEIEETEEDIIQFNAFFQGQDRDDSAREHVSEWIVWIDSGEIL